MSTSIKPDDYVRVKATGELIRVDHVNDNPNRVRDDEYYLDGWGQHGTVVIDEPEEVEKVDWSPPSADDLARALSRLLHDWGEDIEVHETAIEDGEGLVSVGARWKGVGGGFLVRFGPWQEDMA